jgi:hypothetical protein
MRGSSGQERSGSEARRQLDRALRRHLGRGYAIKRNFIALLLVFAWVCTLAGLYDFDLWLLTPVLGTAVLTYAILRRLYKRFPGRRAFLTVSGFFDCLFITAGIYVLGGVQAAALPMFYVFPIFYHSLARSKWQIFLTANTAVVLYAAMAVLEYTGVLPHHSVFGFGNPPGLTYLGLVIGLALMLNLMAAVCYEVARTFEHLAVGPDPDDSRQKNNHRHFTPATGKVPIETA